MGFRTERRLGDADWRILPELQADARLSYKELGRRINLSAPAVAERVRRLEDQQVIPATTLASTLRPRPPSSRCGAGSTGAC